MVLIPVIFIHGINIIGIDTNGIGTSQWLNKYKQFVINYVRFKKWTIKVDILSIDTSGISLIWFNLVWFYGMSTTVGYLMPNSFLKTLCESLMAYFWVVKRISFSFFYIWKDMFHCDLWLTSRQLEE